MKTSDDPRLRLGLIPGEGYGWGHVGTQLSRRLARRLDVELLADREDPARYDEPIFHMLRGADLQPAFAARGSANIGYTFFEEELPPVALGNARQLDLVLAGSSWCVERLKERGIPHADLLIQGIDTELFHPLDDIPAPSPFVVFSGGKFEFRKGQDIVLAAFRELQHSHPDMVLLTAWQNLWPETMKSMEASRHIEFVAPETNEEWPRWVERLCELNGIDSTRVISLPMMSAGQLREVFRRTHVGVFPNRCEGGTNLVLMEYMACGRPVIANQSTGHADVVHSGNALLIEGLKTRELRCADGSLHSRWEESPVGAVAEAMAKAYKDWPALLTRAAVASQEMAALTWDAMTGQLVGKLEPWLGESALGASEGRSQQRGEA